ncbi:bifunctional [glutamate--ammonia ligase]-adenylyl-L-tyrosine phosphorylase/[glutamate--ammonia-ligase] adenylyltransferase [Moraxella canis]|uniref:Bifunctional glutamine synthetase adenylyltransferase/adenylyl-removing enzyme n=1 Tax=Moraxella canis TaxID=90239 RepID=A0ABZ0WYV4_9GAMM|nr:bifunctional [glutamate--ammonia ligase]-adenylyl-L-tyrosine phosphorylase/[glutamate--ammonia-ligase] adenylyltransferase [Moraxella canis]WQE04235.1 bifunctional [glutamate--ammonia ligase]-adenylyl-L-tyrosine phosphorylase/[glutamate--ammonia-ligase] adenylyltransferase [Moraxella canis]
MASLYFVPNQTQLDYLSLASPFASQIYQKHTEDAQVFLGEYGFGRSLSRLDFDALVRRFVGLGTTNYLDFTNEEMVMSGLRKLRQMLMLKWIWQDALSVISLEDLTRELSDFADSCIGFSKDFVYHKLTKRYGEPIIRQKNKTLKDELAIIAMGKLGAQELNLSSDIDLIFVHIDNGETDGKKIIDNHKFMRDLGRGVIKLLDENTEHGFVFRVDMRLRPWGDGSPLVMHMAALDKYFSQHGRTWERFAWLKARVVNDISDEFAQQLSQLSRNFVHRYYIDYSAFSALREMKAMIINQQTQRQDLDNVKLGVGGIRDIEFIVQAFALIYGGHHVRIAENPACLDCLAVLTELDYIDKDESKQLAAAYRFLRRLEHAIQARHDQQTQCLPSNPDEMLAIAQTLGYESVKAFRSVLDAHRHNVSRPFGRMVTDRQSPKQESLDIIQIQSSLDEILGDDSAAALDEFMNSRLVMGLDDVAKDRLNQAYPIILHALLTHAEKDGAESAKIALPRLIALLEAICRRSIYLVMLSENPDATVRLIPTLSASPWIARELAHYPVLLDTFLQKRYLHLPDKTELTDILRQSLLRVEPFDDEGYLTTIRLFKKTQVLAVATADVLGLRHTMKVSDSLTYIAEVVLESALYRAFHELSVKHGFPLLNNGERAHIADCGFAITGYGKLGGLEMGYASDLDLVFLHRIDEKSETDGDKPISGMKFASRLIQKLMNYLATQTRDGRAYEIDTRLRPSGNAGVPVISTHAFELYQTDKAWAWEHQALVRARGLTGDVSVLKEFDRIRKQVLTTPRQAAQVRQDVIEMRQKMQNHLGTKTTRREHGEAEQFNLKQDFGGLIDIEFLAQFMVLAYAHEHSNLAIWPDNVRIFEEVEKTGIWTADRCQKLTQAYLDLRKKTHELALSEQKNVVGDQEWHELRQFVREVWEDVLG